MPASGEHPRIKSSTVSFLPAGCEPSDAEADAIFSVGKAKPAETLFESLASPEEGATRPAPTRKWIAAKTASAMTARTCARLGASDSTRSFDARVERRALIKCRGKPEPRSP